MKPSDLPQKWRDRADDLEPFAPGVARAFRACAEELNAAWLTWAKEPISIAEGADFSGYSRSQIARLVSQGAVPNVGDEDGPPKVRRIDLPLKLGRSSALNGGADLADYILAQRDAG